MAKAKKKVAARSLTTLTIAIDGDIFLMLRKISKLSKADVETIVNVLIATALAKGDLKEA